MDLGDRYFLFIANESLIRNIHFTYCGTYLKQKKHLNLKKDVKYSINKSISIIIHWNMKQTKEEFEKQAFYCLLNW